MTTKFTIGRDLGSGVCQAPGSALGELVTGPRQLLSWLESQLALELPVVSFTARMVPYLNCLRQQDDGNRFYSASLKKDEFGVAGTLLMWRDTWYEAGWDGNDFSTAAPPRLVDVGNVEISAKNEVPPNIGQRVRRAIGALDKTPVDVAVSVLDPVKTFPLVWQQLFEKLGAVQDLYRPDPRCAAQSDLALLQRALVSDRIPCKKTALSGDGSVIVLRDGSPQLSSAWVARFAHAQLVENGSVAILASDHGSTLDDALNEAGYPRLGYPDASFWRPAFQVLPLALELIWKPLDATVLLQFLTHPMGPIPGHIRRPLAEVVSSQPGIGSDNWRRAVNQALDKAVIDLDGDAARKKRKDEEDKIGFWLECERFDPRTGVDIPVLHSRVVRVGAWLSSAFAVQKDEGVAAVYSAALSQADELLRTLDRLRQSGSSTLTRESVRRLIEAVRGSGTSRPGRPWECSPDEPQLLRADTPAAVLQPAQKVIWWSCDDERLPAPYPWSRSECAALLDNGISIVPLNTQLEWQAQSWLRPLLAATEQLVLVLHDNREGHHPVFDEILAVAEGWVEERIDRVMRDPARLPSLMNLPQTQAITKKSTPAKQRWWRLPNDVELHTREKESFSSLEKFLYGPHQWVLNYQARIRPGVLAELTDGARLKGALTHDFFEDFFNQYSDIAAINWKTAESWAYSRLHQLIEQEGAVLMTPGRQGEKEFFVGMAMRALRHLIDQLQSASVVAVEMERKFDGRFGGGGMGGMIDLLATNASGEQAVIDIKWGGLNYRSESLVDSSYLQLAVYAQLARQGIGKWPVLGYFIIRDARMIMLDSDYFPRVKPVQPANGESQQEFWQRVEQTWKWRRAQIDRQLIEVPVTDTEPDEDSSPGEFGLEMPDTFDKFDDYTVLTGWSENS